MAGELVLTKTEVELAHFSDYLLRVHLLGASFTPKWGIRNHHFCREWRHLASYSNYNLSPLPVDLGYILPTGRNCGFRDVPQGICYVARMTMQLEFTPAILEE